MNSSRDLKSEFISPLLVFNIDENSSNGTGVGSVIASDADGDGNLGSTSHTNGNPIHMMVDKSGLGNDALQDVNSSQPSYIDSALNGNAVVRFDGQDDYLEFNEINSIRTIFMVINRNIGNQGFLLGHETSYAFHPGNNSVWSDVGSSTYLLNGILHVNGSSYDGLSQDFPSGTPSIISIRSTAMLPASSFSKDRSNDVYWDGDLCELIIYQEELPVSTMRMVEGYLAHKWGIENSLVSTHPFQGFPPERSTPAAITKI